MIIVILIALTGWMLHLHGSTAAYVGTVQDHFGSQIMGAINIIRDMGVVGLDVEATTDDGSREHSCLAVSETEVSLFLSFFFLCKQETGVS